MGRTAGLLAERTVTSPSGRLMAASVATMASLVAWAVTVWIWPWVRPNVSPLFFLAVAGTAWFGGLVPAAVATVVGGVLSSFYIGTPDEGAATFDAGDLLRLCAMLAMAVLISWLNLARSRMQVALAESDRLRADLQDRGDRLRAANEALQREAVERQEAQDRVLAHQQVLRRMAGDLAITAERERRAIATELHDEIGQLLAISQIKLEALSAGTADSGVRAATDEIRNLIRRSIEQTRNLTRRLSPPVLFEAGLEPAIEWLADQYRRDHGLAVHVVYRGAAAPVREEPRMVVFQAVREMLMNVVKHARATAAHVTVFHQPTELRVVVEDDGRGCDPARAFGGDGHSTRQYGLLNIRERVTYLGGQFECESDPVDAGGAGGIRFTLTLPMTADFSGDGDAR